MPSLKFEIEYETKTAEKSDGVPVIIVAAGSSSRMQGINKIFADLYGIPVLARTLLAFERNASVSEIIVVIKEENVKSVYSLAENYMISKLSRVTTGGKTRLDSVEKGMLLIDGAKGVMVHDGARPFVSDRLITDMAKAALCYDCSVCGVKVKDTIKRIEDENVTTVKRDNLYAIQTPQSLNFDKYLKALSKYKNKESFTDDASLMEAEGYMTKIIDGEENNFKITTKSDLKYAEFLLREEMICE